MIINAIPELDDTKFMVELGLTYQMDRQQALPAAILSMKHRMAKQLVNFILDQALETNMQMIDVDQQTLELRFRLALLLDEEPLRFAVEPKTIAVKVVPA